MILRTKKIPELFVVDLGPTGIELYDCIARYLKGMSKRQNNAKVFIKSMFESIMEDMVYYQNMTLADGLQHAAMPSGLSFHLDFFDDDKVIGLDTLDNLLKEHVVKIFTKIRFQLPASTNTHYSPVNVALDHVIIRITITPPIPEKTQDEFYELLEESARGPKY